MPLTEAAFTAIVDAGCPACGGKKVTVSSYVAQQLPLLGGELYGSASWGYKGEDLVRGTFHIACAGCAHALYTSTSCPRCDADDRLEAALEAENALALPVRCTACGSELVTASAYVPATVAYEGKRGAKARTETAPEDPGFHAFRFECKGCRNTTEQKRPCPLCGA